MWATLMWCIIIGAFQKSQQFISDFLCILNNVKSILVYIIGPKVGHNQSRWSIHWETTFMVLKFWPNTSTYEDFEGSWTKWKFATLSLVLAKPCLFFVRQCLIIVTITVLPLMSNGHIVQTVFNCRQTRSQKSGTCVCKWASLLCNRLLSNRWIFLIVLPPMVK